MMPAGVDRSPRKALCAADSCATVAWQMRRGSALATALGRAPHPMGTAVTSIGTLQDEVVYPRPAPSDYRVGTTTMVQDVCRGPFAEHGSLIADAAAYALVVDALTHDGPARKGRIDRSVCGHMLLPGTRPASMTGFLPPVLALTVGLADPLRWVGAEPRLPAYAR